MPRFRDRWPAAAASLAHSAGLCAEAAEIVRACAASDYAEVVGTDATRLRLGPLCELGAVRARGVLRHWLHERAVPPLPARRLREAVEQLAQALDGGIVRALATIDAHRRYLAHLEDVRDNGGALLAEDGRPLALLRILPLASQNRRRVRMSLIGRRRRQPASLSSQRRAELLLIFP